MTITRRDLGGVLAGLSMLTNCSEPVSAAQSNSGDQKIAVDKPAHDMTAMPANWFGQEQIGFVIYPGFTALDMVGPHYMLTNLMGATTHIVAKSKEPVASDTGLIFTPSVTFSECPAELDILFVPGGSTGTLAAIRDHETLSFIRDRGNKARFVTSVCTGSLVLGAAGLLVGYQATSHWITKPLLKKCGAIIADGRFVKDRNRITGGGVTAGIDFGLFLVSLLRDQAYAETVQLLAEYDPHPPFDSGSPEKAKTEVKSIMDDMFVSFLSDMDLALSNIGFK